MAPLLVCNAIPHPRSPCSAPLGGGATAENPDPTLPWAELHQERVDMGRREIAAALTGEGRCGSWCTAGTGESTDIANTQGHGGAHSYVCSAKPGADLGTVESSLADFDASTARVLEAAAAMQVPSRTYMEPQSC